MRVALTRVLTGILLPAAIAAAAFSRDLPDELKGPLEEAVVEAYQSASTEFPCKLKAKGKPSMLEWQNVDKCVNGAYEEVDWDSLSLKLRQIHQRSGLPPDDFLSAVESSLAAHAVPFDRVFSVKNADALLPLSNSLLKFLPPDSLIDLPVYDRAGTKAGSFSGSYTFEKMGVLSGTRQRHTLFQYTDRNGKMQTSTEKLLLDSFGVPWKDAAPQPGFRLLSERINLGRETGRIRFR